MDQLYDVLIVGGGSAATSAAMTLRNRGKSIAVVTNKPETSSLYKAEKITNYPGLPPMTGAEITALFRKQLEDTGAFIIEGRTISVLPMEDSFGVAVGSDYYMARSIIITAGITREKLYPGEAEFLGRGVSYCATLEGIGCQVLRFEKNGKYEISGGMKADTLTFAGESHKVDCVFIIKDTVSVTQLVPGLTYENGGIVVDRHMATAVPGVFAAGDCTGKPLQLAKAVGEGNVAALSACDWLDRK